MNPRRWPSGAQSSLKPTLKLNGVSAVGLVPSTPLVNRAWPNGSPLAPMNADGSVWLWGGSTHRPLRAPPPGPPDVAAALSFSPDGRTLASAGADHTVRLWDVRTRRPLGRPLDAYAGWVSAVAFSPHSDRLASAGEDGTVRLWDPILWSHDRKPLAD